MNLQTPKFLIRRGCLVRRVLSIKPAGPEVCPVGFFRYHNMQKTFTQNSVIDQSSGLLGVALGTFWGEPKMQSNRQNVANTG